WCQTAEPPGTAARLALELAHSGHIPTAGQEPAAHLHPACRLLRRNGQTRRTSRLRQGPSRSVAPGACRDGKRKERERRAESTSSEQPRGGEQSGRVF